MIHVVFQQADVEVIKKAMELEESLSGDVFEIKDEWGVGPIAGLDTSEGWDTRQNWWREQLTDTPYGPDVVGSFDDRETVKSIKAWLSENEKGEAWIWMGQNQHDVTGYYWLMPQLREFQGRVMVLYLNNLPFLNEKGQLFYPWGVHDILPKEAVKAKKLARAITLSEYEVDPDEWKKLSDENAIVRILEGGKKIVGKEANFYDAEILKNLTADWQKASRVIQNTLNRMKIKTGDVFLMGRVRQMISEQRIDVTGDVTKSWKDFELRLKTAQQMEITGV
ncbi:MAG: DUF1835 domain-containing protein [Chitinophagaceae bacterium]|nr:DUF1835 domain-containing protein [Chitinophagaceae bacterium]